MTDRATFYLAGEDSDNRPRYVAVGNPHTEHGLVSLISIDGGLGFSARFTELEAADEFSRGWLEGYAAGNEPQFSFEVLPNSRLDRERDFYKRFGYELPSDRIGLVSLNVLRDANGDPSLYQVFGDICRLMAEIADLSGGIAEWIPILEGAELSAVSSDLTPSAVANIFRRLNFDELDDGGIQNWSLRLCGRPDSPMFHDFIELVSWVEFSGDRVCAIRVTINLEDESEGSLYSSEEHHSGWLLSLITACSEVISADFSWVSSYPVSSVSTGFLLETGAESDLFSVLPGWCMYFSERIARNYPGCINDILSDYRIEDVDSGVLVVGKKGLADYSVAQADVVALAFADVGSDYS